MDGIIPEQLATNCRKTPEDRQDEVIAATLKPLWRTTASPDALHRFRHLSEMLDLWRRDHAGSTT